MSDSNKSSDSFVTCLDQTTMVSKKRTICQITTGDETSAKEVPLQRKIPKLLPPPPSPDKKAL